MLISGETACYELTHLYLYRLQNLNIAIITERVKQLSVTLGVTYCAALFISGFAIKSLVMFSSS